MVGAEAGEPVSGVGEGMVGMSPWTAQSPAWLLCLCPPRLLHRPSAAWKIQFNTGERLPILLPSAPTHPVPAGGITRRYGGPEVPVCLFLGLGVWPHLHPPNGLFLIGWSISSLLSQLQARTQDPAKPLSPDRAPAPNLPSSLRGLCHAICHHQDLPRPFWPLRVPSGVHLPTHCCFLEPETPIYLVSPSQREATLCTVAGPGCGGS